jgi:hypothetical protein
VDVGDGEEFEGVVLLFGDDGGAGKSGYDKEGGDIEYGDDEPKEGLTPLDQDPHDVITRPLRNGIGKADATIRSTPPSARRVRSVVSNSRLMRAWAGMNAEKLIIRAFGSVAAVGTMLMAVRFPGADASGR